MDAPQSNRKFFVLPTAQCAAQKGSSLFSARIIQAVADRRKCTIALAGGSTPRMLYSALAAAVGDCDVPWDSVHVFFSDERDVPHDHLDSNYHTAQRTLLDFVPIPPQQVHPMPADSDDLTRSAESYAQAIRQIVPAGENGIPRFDIVLLGVGADGHTASLFPGSDALDEEDRLVLSPYVPSLGRHRMTFTLPLINAARCVMMFITQGDKASVVSEMFDPDGHPSLAPAARVNPATGEHLVVLDSAAAQKLPLALRRAAD
jgi:6-phosphogluconolactonase